MTDRPNTGPALAFEERTGPLWQRIHETLGDEIDSGRYRAGAKLPTEAALSQRFGVNRHTVRRALEELQEAGRIHVRRGSGAFVTQGRFDYPIGAQTRLSRNLADLGLSARRTFLRLETLCADARDARMLSLAEGAPIHVTESVSEADGVPIVYALAVYPAERMPGLLDLLAQDAGITRALAALGYGDYRRAWTRLTAERPGTMIARHLKMPEVHPVLLAESLNVDDAGVPVQYGRSWFCSDRVQLVVDPATFPDSPQEEP
jgi:GntR family phosphonate transport system transcriptional regulator